MQIDQEIDFEIDQEIDFVIDQEIDFDIELLIVSSTTEKSLLLADLAFHSRRPRKQGDIALFWRRIGLGTVTSQTHQRFGRGYHVPDAEILSMHISGHIP